MTQPQLERVLVDFLRRWMATAVHAAERDEPGRVPGRLPIPEAIVRFDENRRFAADELPAVVVQVPDRARISAGRARHTWDAEYPVLIGVVTAADDAPNARDNAGTYIAAVRDALTGHQTLDGNAQGVELVGDVILDAPATQSTWMAFGEVAVLVTVRGVARRGGGPADPDPADRDPASPPDQPDPITGLDIESYDVKEPLA